MSLPDFAIESAHLNVLPLTPEFPIPNLETDW